MGKIFSGDGSIRQVLTPKEIINVGSGNLDVSTWVAFCFPNDEVTVQLNGTGEVITIDAGRSLGIHPEVNSITFSGITTAKCLVM